jgi:phage terminase small subunit
VADNTGLDDLVGDDLPVEIPRPQSPLTPEQKKVWRYVGEALFDAGLIHCTDALMLMVIARTYCKWIDLEAKLEAYAESNAGEYTWTTDKGYVMVHPLFHAAQQEKKALLQWLPEAALTIASYRKAKQALGDDRQPGLFGADELHQHIRNKPRVA